MDGCLLADILQGYMEEVIRTYAQKLSRTFPISLGDTSLHQRC